MIEVMMPRVTNAGRRYAGRLLAALALLTLAAVPGVGEDEGGDFLVGRLLVATPQLEGSFFDQTVIYLVEHNAEGAFGLIVNRPLGDIGVKPLFERMGLDASDAEGRVLARIGGPVEPGAAFVLHHDDGDNPESTTVLPGIAMTTDPAILKRIGRGEGPKSYLFVFGYSGWAPGQLESEIERGSWVDIPADDAFLFDQDDAAKWQSAVDRYSVDL
jgi:putative transcriptional regulator